MKKPFFFLLLGLGGIFAGTVMAQDSQIEKAKIFKEEFPLISESDYYCSFYILEGALPDIKIVGSERQEEKILLSDSDKFFIDKGEADGLETGQLFLVIGIGPKIKHYGHLATRSGRARIIQLEDKRGVVRVDKTCGEITLGSYLIPFEEKESVIGKDEGFSQPLDENQGVKGSVIYLETDVHIIGSGYRGIIDLGMESGIQIGQQMTVFKRTKGNLPREAIGNLVVIDVQPRTSTFKILSCRESIELGSIVQTK